MLFNRRGTVLVGGLVISSVVLSLVAGALLFARTAGATPPFPTLVSTTVTFAPGTSCDPATATATDLMGRTACIVSSTPLSQPPHMTTFACSVDGGATWFPSDQCLFKFTQTDFYGTSTIFAQEFYTRWSAGSLQLIMFPPNEISDYGTLVSDQQAMITYSAM